MALIGLDTSQYERTIGGGGGSTPLPVGFYSGVITRAKMTDCSAQAKDPSGKYLEVEFDITSPVEHGNRKFWDKFNLVNSNSVAVKIGREQLADLAKSLGFTTLGDSDDLIGRECCFYLMIEPSRGSFSASNKCMKYLPIGSTEADYKAWYAGKKGEATNASEPKKVWGGEQTAEPVAATTGAPPWKKQS